MTDHENNDNLQQNQESSITPNSIPQPILTPTTVSLNSSGIDCDSAKEYETGDVLQAENIEQDSAKPGKSKKVIFLSIALVVLAGIITVIVLALNGVFSKDASKAPFTSLDQLNDEQIRLMDKAANLFIKEDLEHYPEIAGKIIIDKLNNVGMMLVEELSFTLSGSGSAAPQNKVIMSIYQVQLTDKTGEKPIKRQYFTWLAFEISEDRSKFQPTSHYESTILQFDNWYTEGCLDLDRLAYEMTKNTYKVIENKIDKSRLLPFDGKDPSEFVPHELVSKPEQMTEAMLRAAQNSHIFQSELENISNDFPEDMKEESRDYVGMLVYTNENKTENKVVLVYKFTYQDLTTDPAEQKYFYWYSWFDNAFFEGGQIRLTTLVSDKSTTREWILLGKTNTADLRKVLKSHFGSSWNCEDDLPDEP